MNSAADGFPTTVTNWDCVVPLEQFRLAWRFTDPKYAVLPDDHLEQVFPLSDEAAQVLHEWTTSKLHRDFPFTKDFFTRIESAHISDTAEDNQRIKKWLNDRGIPFNTSVYLSYNSDAAVRTSWKMLVKYWNEFFYLVSDDLTVVDETARWAVLFWHEGEVFHGTNVVRS